MPAKIPAEKWAAYFDLRESGVAATGAAKQAGFSVESALRFERLGTGRGAQAALELGRTHVMGRLILPKLEPVAQRGLDDFAHFRQRFFGRRSVPWQVDAAKKVVAALDDVHHETKMVINAPPGTGKSTTFTHDIPAWLIARDRSIRIMIGSRTEHQATMYSRRIRNTLTRKTTMKASTRDIQGGYAKDAQSTLVKDFGPFQSEDRAVGWRADGFTVAQPGGDFSDEKENTVTAYGMDSGFLGGRFDVVIWDDLVDNKNMKTEVMRAEIIEWWDTQAEARLEPWGVFIIQGQRITADDLYRYCLDKKTLEGAPDYIHIKYPAHDEMRCVGRHEGLRPWPDTCLLDPKRLPYSKLEAIKNNNPRVYQVVYQQEDLDAEQALIDPLWIYGGTDPQTNVVYQGCLDSRRQLREVPEKLRDGSSWSVVTVDPSPTKWWAVHWWGYHPASDERILLDTTRAKMSTTDFLTMDLDTGVYTGLVEDLRDYSVKAGFPLDVVIVERNAAQRFMLQSPIWGRWLSMFNVSLIPHETTSNKTSEFGVETLQTPIKAGRTRLPGAVDSATKTAVDRLIHELTHYPGAQDSDQVMAAWFFEHHLAKSWTPKQSHYQFSRPGYLAESERGMTASKPRKPKLNFRIVGSRAVGQ